VTDRFEKYLDYFLSMLVEDRLVVPRGNGFEVLRGPDTLRPVEAIERELSAASPLFAGQARLLAHCVSAFPRALPEGVASIEVLYPEGKNELLRATYEGSIQEREDEYIRLMFERVVRRIVDNRDGRPLRILEAGGGYGVMMRRIVPLLRGLPVEYYFTDVGKTFLSDAKDFAIEQGYDFMTFGSFDVTKDPTEQGLEPGSFDLVFAFNVVHATRSLGASVENLRRLLKDGGLLCLLERTKARRYVDLIWGLADGWWHFDEGERALSPLVDLARWAAIARDAGFEEVLAYPETPELRRRLDVGIVIARTPRRPGRALRDDAPRAAWELPALAEGTRLDGLVVIDEPQARSASAFQPVGDALVSGPSDYDGYAPVLADWIGRHRPGFVTVWSSGAGGACPRDAAARLRAASELDRRGGRVVEGAGAWSRVFLPFGSRGAADVPPVPAAAAVREALRAVEGRLTLAVVQPEAQALFAPVPRAEARGRATQPAGGAAAPASADEAEGYTGLLRDLWTDLLGIEAIDLDDDFFRLGGDSLKVAQLTTELEKHGIKLMSNEVFNRPTIRGLAEYLKTNRLEREGRIGSADDLLRACRETLGVPAAYQTYVLGGQEYRILFLDDSLFEAGRDPEAAVRALDVPARIEPHYVYPLSRFVEAGESSAPGDFWRAMGLVDQPAPGTIGAMVREVQDGLARLSDAVCGGGVAVAYPLSPFQRMYLKGSARFSFYLIDFDEPLDRPLLNRAFTDVVGAQGLLRSSLHRRFGKPQWAEHVPPEGLSVPVVDLSGYSPPAQAQLLEQLMASEYEADFDEAAGLMYRVLLVRFDRRRHTLLFNLDHSIFDNMSGQVLRRQLLNRYRALVAGNVAPMEPVKAFREYLEQIDQGPQGITEKRLVDLFELKQYEASKTAVEERIVSRRQPATGKLHYELDLAKFRLSDDEEATWDLTLAVLSCVLARFLEQEAVPLKIVYQGRTYQDRSYFDTLGLFVDVLPLLVRVDRDDPAAMLEGIKRKVRFVNRYNVNFMNMLLNVPMPFVWWGVLPHISPIRIRWSSVLAHISPRKLSPRDPMILLNYVGKAEKEYRKVIDFATRQMETSGRKLDYASFYAIATVADGRLVFDIFCNFEKDMDVLRRLFDEEAGRLLSKGAAGEPASLVA
jgi:SAM-dependent methyltransferase/acyl carrier protein